MCNDEYCTEFDLCDSCEWDKVPFISKQFLGELLEVNLNKSKYTVTLS